MLLFSAYLVAMLESRNQCALSEFLCEYGLVSAFHFISDVQLVFIKLTNVKITTRILPNISRV